MSVIWLIENVEDGKTPLFESLAGNFPVRLFASFSSFQSLAKAEKSHLPRIVIFRGDEKELGNFCKSSALLFPDACHIVLDEQGEDPGRANPSLTNKTLALRSDEPHFELQRFLKKISHLFTGDQALFHYNGLRLNMEKLECWLESDGQPVPLSLKEAKLLRLFLQSAGKPLSRSDIMTVIWDTTKVSPRTIDCHISRLRKKLQHFPISIEGKYGGGYMFN